MRLLGIHVVGGVLCASCLSTGVPAVAEDVPAPAVPVKTEDTGPGSVIWERQLGTDEADQAFGVATDAAGNVVMVGETFGSLVGPGKGNGDGFVAKYDADGKHLWTSQLGTGETDAVLGVATDTAENSALAGYTAGSLARPFIGGYADAFVAKYDSRGKRLWTRQLGTNRGDEANSVTMDGSGNVAIAGFNDPRGPWNPSNVFVTKYDSGGKRLWTRRLGTDYTDRAQGVATDAAGNVVITGVTGDALVGPQQGVIDAFVVEYDAKGERRWARQLGTAESDFASGVAIDNAGNVAIAGTTLGSLGGPNYGNEDAFIIKLRP